MALKLSMEPHRVGSFGKLIFTCSDKRVVRPDNISLSGGGVWADHEIIGDRTKREFKHPELRQVTMDVTFTATLGVRPRKMLELVRKYSETGKSYPLVIGNVSLSKYKMALISYSETWDELVTGGRLAKATVSLTFEEVSQ